MALMFSAAANAHPNSGSFPDPTPNPGRFPDPTPNPGRFPDPTTRGMDDGPSPPVAAILRRHHGDRYSIGTSFYRTRGKRVLDIALVCLGAPLAAPVLLVVAASVRWKMGRPVLHTATRAGRYGRSFIIYKFRSMTSDRDNQGALLPDAQRLTPLGLWLRRSSMDELPQLLNVLRGDMSLVGPRALPTLYLPRYSPEQMRRHEVLPGMVGWAGVVGGRNDQSWEQKFELDVWYVDHQSLRLDLAVLLKMVRVVISGQGVAESGQATATDFVGRGEHATGRT